MVPSPLNSVSLQKGFILLVSFCSLPEVCGPQGQAEQLCITMELFWDACAAHPVMSQCLHPLLAGPFLTRWLNIPIGTEMWRFWSMWDLAMELPCFIKEARTFPVASRARQCCN